MVRLRMQTWSGRQRRKRRCMSEGSIILKGDRQSPKNRRVFGEIAEKCARYS
jgi:hypothetical protein